MFRARDIDSHFRSVTNWVAWDKGSCDSFKHGDPDAEVKGIAVAWQSSMAALQEAHAKGLNLFITHEPTFYSHMDDDERMRASEPARRKMAFLDDTGIVVYRCHDTWDVFPKIGIVDAWSDYLGLGAPIATQRYYNLHEVPTTTAWELTHRIARAVSGLGEQMVQLVGAKSPMVTKLAVGTGAITNVRHMVAMGADAVLVSDDGTVLWRDAAWAADLGVPMIIVNHMTAEIPGLQKLVIYLREQFPGVPIEFVGATCQYEIFATELMHEVPVRMRLDSLDALPALSVPEGYRLAPMKADEAWAYVAVMNQSCYSGEIGLEWFEETFGRDKDYDPSYLMIIWKGDEPVAVAGAWHTDAHGEPWGMIHWVGAARSERGKSLGKLVTLAALHRLRERGFSRAMLGTQTWRLPAIAAYMRLGFRPWPDERAPQSVWDETLARLEAWRTQTKR